MVDEVKATSPGESASETKTLDYPSLHGVQEARERREKAVQEKVDKEMRETYPKMAAEKKAEMLTGSPKGDLGKDYELTADDPETGELENAIGLFESEKYEELSDLVERELTEIGAGVEEIGLFNFAKKHASDSPEWAAWIKNAVENLYQHKRAARLHGQE